MNAGRLLLSVIAAGLALAAVVPTAMEPVTPAAAAPVVAQAGVPPVGLPGSTTTFATGQSYDGEPRNVVLHVPDGLLAPAPLVIALHAHAQGTRAIRTYTRLERLADEQGFIVAFPDGGGGSWNAGSCCFPGSETGTDDVAFLDEVLRQIRARVLVDPARIAVTGGSNGAMMGLRWACERPSVVSAVAVVSGPFVATCTPSEPVPVLVLHGARDRAVPLKGGRNNALRATFPDLSRSLEPFRRAGGEVELLVVPSAGHEWMTRDKHGVDATRTIWNWIRDHPRPL